MFAATRHIATARGIPVIKGSVNLGATGSLTVANNVALQMRTGNFCIEAWVNSPFSSFNVTLVDKGSTGAGSLTVTSGGATGKQMIAYGQSYSSLAVMSVNMTANTWQHVALVKSSSTMYWYLDGVQVGSAANSTDFSSTSTLSIGSLFNQTEPLGGYISNFRIVKGSPVYTSSFTPPTQPLTAISGTSLLTCQSPTTITDASTNGFTITARSGAAASSVSPFA